MFDLSKGYKGFKSQLGVDIFKSRYQWNALSILFVSPAEHLIDGKRYDLELQINHVPFLTDEEQ
jgi:carbonic anhydrase